MRLVLCLLLIVGLRAEASGLLPKCTNVNFEYNESTKNEIDQILSGRKPNTTLLSKAILAASISNIDYLKKHNSFNNLFDAMSLTLSSDMKIFDQILKLISDKDINTKSKTGVTLLFQAADCAQSHAVKRFIHLGADVNIGLANGVTPLINAVMQGNAEIVELLVKEGASCKSTLNKKLDVISLAHRLNLNKIIKLLERCCL